MSSDARSTTEKDRFVIDARYVAPKPSGIGRHAEALIEHLPKLAPDEQFELWTHPERPRPVAFDNVHCTPPSRARQFSCQRTATETLEVYREAARAHAAGKRGAAHD